MAEEYIIGIDPYGYDDVTMNACVISKGDLTIVYHNETRNNREEFEKNVKMVAKYYSIPDKDILIDKSNK